MTMVSTCGLLIKSFVFVASVLSIENADPKDSLRLSEIHLNVAYLGTSASFLFVEIFSPLGVVDLTGSTVVFYSASTQLSFAYCSCDNAKTNDLGYGCCNCGISGITTNFAQGAVAFHNTPYSVFNRSSITAEQAVSLNLTDVVLYQFSGTPISNPLQNIFAPGQVFHYPPPQAKSAYSVVRCYGTPETNAKWQAAYTWTYTATKNGPNICPVPILYVNELHLNKSYIELASSSPELPLDAATIAIIVDNGTSAIITDSVSLQNQRMESTGLITIGMVPGADILKRLLLPIIEPAIVIVYYNVTIAKDSLAPATNFTSSLIYSTTATLNSTVPLNLKQFGNKIYSIDLSGICSLSVCTNVTDVRLATPTPITSNNCTIGCSLSNNAKATVRLSEVHSNVAWAGSQVTFTFVEVFTPLGSIDLTGLTVVFYFPENVVSNFTSWNCCSCNGIKTNDLGYGLCNCGPKGIQRVPADVAYQGAIALQLVDSSFFANSVSASVGYQLNVLDSIVYQSYGPVDDTNPMKKLFAPGQHHVIAPPLTQSAFSIDRCYGNPLTTGTWQASFRSIFPASPNAPNPCPPPYVFIDEIHFNPDFIELLVYPGELPLDQLTITFVSEDGTISSAFPLDGEKADFTKYFSVGTYAGVDLNKTLNMPTIGTTAIVVYFNISIAEKANATTSDFLSALIYSETSVIVPPVLLPFGNKSFIADISGHCSLGNCQQNATDFQLITPSLNAEINCTSATCEI